MSKNDLAVSAEGLSKVYRIGLKEQAQDSLAGALINLVRSPLKNYRKYRSLYRFDDLGGSEATSETPADVIWALRDASFTIRHGEVVGFIGRNGAGKSTLLKILTRITPPTRGSAEIRGRVASLLEVGTGFHHELTGRENIYLNGTILGMTKNEVDRKFDEIVAFSGVERFLDTPVKRYSSGMAVRLAFAVAAHLEPEILIVDEVLAVGDISFQQKCLSKMQDVRKSGRTVLFVSHNMPAVAMLCSRAIHLDGGRIVNDGPTHDVLSGYLDTASGIPSSREWTDSATAPTGGVARLTAARIVSRKGVGVDTVDIKEGVGIQLEYDVVEAGHEFMADILVYNDEGLVVFETPEQDPVWQRRARPVGRYISTVWVPGNLLRDGRYLVSVALITRHPDVTQFFEQQVVGFHVVDSMGEGTARGDYSGPLSGAVRPLLKWDSRIMSSHDANATR
jgi:lipopolysaccharide transport system ATP-binding protein